MRIMFRIIQTFIANKHEYFDTFHTPPLASEVSNSIISGQFYDNWKLVMNLFPVGRERLKVLQLYHKNGYNRARNTGNPN